MADDTEELRIRLRTTRATRLYLEPWGNEFDCPAGVTFQVVGRGPKGDGLELEVGEDVVTIYGWPGSVVSVLRDGMAVASKSAPSP